MRVNTYDGETQLPLGTFLYLSWRRVPRLRDFGRVFATSG
jgi:hypothetical protein